MIINKSKLLANENLLLPNDTLSLKCEFGISLGTVTDQNVVTSCEDDTTLLKGSDDLSMTFNEKNDSEFVTELQTDLKSMLDDGTLFDAGLQIGSEVIRVHKNILSARSPVFRAMFAKDTKEATSNTVVIEDTDVDTLRELLLYMYTDTIKGYQWENMKKLYFASDKYEVLSLKKKCVCFLKKNLSVSNVCEALVFADLHQVGDLMTAALAFISECHSAIFALKEWKELEKNNPPFALKVMREICCNKKKSD
ncbi:Speckle-type POZ protein-like B [Araneus ventricosus]|uniref:Speckle-type POZ protein-like B n=1 Tax=Araneus ventricosus TaxID=182803 RepID=A0A4Y2P300_ARAVE|nr:Speckle-type POZ protein-like B [Araneus ventricosus]GBN47781.1 Speckle-type POZ protein-like B [Araneus ventricosus]